MACIGGMIANASADERQAGRLTIGSEVRSEITIADHVNYTNGSRSKLYRVSAKPGDPGLGCAQGPPDPAGGR